MKNAEEEEEEEEEACLDAEPMPPIDAIPGKISTNRTEKMMGCEVG